VNTLSTLPHSPSLGKRTHRMSGGTWQVWRTWPWLLFHSSLHSSYAPVKVTVRVGWGIHYCSFASRWICWQVVLIGGVHRGYKQATSNAYVWNPSRTQVSADWGAEHIEGLSAGFKTELEPRQPTCFTTECKDYCTCAVWQEQGT
jgi:hypothetical protein